MAASISVRAIVVRLVEYSESSQIVSFFTAEHGQVGLIAKGIKRGTRKRFKTGVDLLELGELGFVAPRGDAGLGTLTDWLQLDSFSGLRRTLSRLYAGLYVAELLSTLTEDGDPHPALFEATVEVLSELSGGGPLRAQLGGFQRSLLGCIGYLPEMDRCMDCGQVRAAEAPTYFSSTAGGLICRDCEMHHVEKCAAPNSSATGELAEEELSWLRLYDYHLRHIAGREFKTAERLFGIIASE